MRRQAVLRGKQKRRFHATAQRRNVKEYKI